MKRRTLVAALAILTLTGLAACKPKVDAAYVDSGAKFLKANAALPGVVTLPSGLQYKVLHSGPEAGARPKPEDEVKVHYEGKLLTGDVFDSSFERGTPTTFILGQVIPGWIEGLQLMRPGDEWELYIPAELGYGMQDKGLIPPGSTLIFRVQLIDFLASAGHR